MIRKLLEFLVVVCVVWIVFDIAYPFMCPGPQKEPAQSNVQWTSSDQ